jgi:hypothetical protein
MIIEQDTEMVNNKKKESAVSKAQKELAKIYDGRSPFSAVGADIRITVKGNETKFEIISFTEDFEQDYEYFISIAKMNENISIQKRWLRAAFLMLNFFLEASINHLCSIAHLDIGEKGEYNFRKSFYEKCKFLEKTLDKDIFPQSEKGKLRDIRNEMVHFKGNNISLWDKITLDDIELYRDKGLLWLEEIKKGMKLQTISSEDLFNFFGA